MMGERRAMQEALFYGFSLERHGPDDHMLRKIDRFVDLSGLRAHLGPYYSDVGRPSIDPELMMRMLIVGYCFGIRSDGGCPNMPARKIARSVHEAARDKARAIAKTEAYVVSCRERKKVEMLFAHLKRILRLGRLRLRGPSGAKDELLLSRHRPKSPETGKAHPSSGAIFAA